MDQFDSKFKQLKEEHADIDFGDNLMPEYELFEGDKGILFAGEQKKL